MRLGKIFKILTTGLVVAAISLGGMQVPAFADASPIFDWAYAGTPIDSPRIVDDDIGVTNIGMLNIPVEQCGIGSSGLPKAGGYSLLVTNETSGTSAWSVYGGDTHTSWDPYVWHQMSAPYPTSTWVVRGYLNCNNTPLNEIDQSKPDLVSSPMVLNTPHVSVESYEINVDLEGNQVELTTELNRVSGRWSAYQIRDLGGPNQLINPIESHKCESNNKNVPPRFLKCSINWTQYDSIGIAIGKTKWDLGAVNQWPPVGVQSDSFLITPADIVQREIDQRQIQGGKSNTETNPCAATCTTGDPVDVENGNFYDTKYDSVISGRIGLNSNRTYSVTNRNVDGGFGRGWVSSYGMRVDASSDGVLVTEENGSQINFKLKDGLYAPEYIEVKASLSKDGDDFIFQRWDSDIKYRFDATGKMVLQSFGAEQVSMTYDSSGKLDLVSETGRSLKFNWSDDRIASVVDHSGRTYSYEYNADDRLSKVVNDGVTIATYQYDALGRMTQFTDKLNGITSNIYDDQNRVMEQSLPGGDVIKLEFVQNPTFPSITETRIVGGPEDGWKYHFMSGRLYKKYGPSGVLILSFTYDPNSGLLKKVVHSNVLKSIGLEYDDKGRIVSQKQLKDFYGMPTTTEYSDSNKPIKVVTPDGISTSLQYNENDLLKSKTVESADKTLAQVTQLEYDNVQHANDITSITNPLGGVTAIEYTDQGEASKVIDPSGNIVTNEYDNFGRIIKHISTQGNATPSDASLFSTTYGYDTKDNQTSIASSSGLTRATYNSNSDQVSSIDALGQESFTEYDLAGRVTKKIKPGGEHDTFEYSTEVANGSILKVKTWTDSLGLITKYKMDSNGQTIVVSPDGTVVNNYVNSNSRISSGHKTVNGIYQFDFISDIQDGGYYSTTRGGGSEQKSSFDFSGRKTQDYDSLTGIIQNYSYDGLGRLISVSSPSHPGRDREYEYDISDNVTSTKYPDGSTVESEFNSSSQQIQATDWSGHNFNFEYNPDGQLKSMHSDSGLGYVQSFDKGQSTSKLWKDSAGTESAKFDSAFTSGQITEDSKKVGGSTAADRAFEFNNNGQITKSNDDPFSWVGNQVASTDKLKSLTYDASGRLNSTVDRADSTTDYSYDNQGQRTKAGAVDYEWSSLGYLTSVGTTTYGYDGAGVRASINDAQQVYDQSFKLMSNGDTKYLWSLTALCWSRIP